MNHLFNKTTITAFVPQEELVHRQQHEAESLQIIQRLDWEWKMKEIGSCDHRATPVIDATSVPIVAVQIGFPPMPKLY